MTCTLHTLLLCSPTRKNFAGLKPQTPVLHGKLWDFKFSYCSLYKITRIDLLHHVELGPMKRLGVDLLKVSDLGHRHTQPAL